MHFATAFLGEIKSVDRRSIASTKVKVLEDKEMELTITEGKFHQVKRMLKAVNNEVVYLKRLSMGSLLLDANLELGKYRPLTEMELSELISK